MDNKSEVSGSICTEFKFPFTDNRESELSFTESYHASYTKKTHITPFKTNSQNDDYFSSPSDDGIDTNGGSGDNAKTVPSSPSNFGMEYLSPIAKSQESDTSNISCEGDTSKGQTTKLHPEDPTPISLRSSLYEEPKAQHQIIDGKNTNKDIIVQKKVETMEQIDHAIIAYESSSPVASSSVQDSAPPTTDDLKSAKKQVGERSSEFIDKIRSAAHKRRVAVTRSRDSLVAKENEQIRLIDESKIRSTASVTNDLQTVNENIKEIAAKENIAFNSRPHSNFSSHKNRKKSVGFGGVGVPKVEKRPTTTPFSPLLGSRRKKGGDTVNSKIMERNITLSGTGSITTKNGMASKSSNNGKTSCNTHKTSASNNRLRKSKGKRGEQSSSTKVIISATLIRSKQIDTIGVSTQFKARPIPSSANRRYHAGQVGVPKVSKRAVTVPVSPCLGPKKQSTRFSEVSKRINNDDSKRQTILKIHPSKSSSLKHRSLSPSSVTSSVKSLELMGLNLIDSRLDSTPEEITKDVPKKTQNHNDDDDKNTTPTNISSSILPFEPRSTSRATMRKSYDIRRDQNRECKLEEERAQLKLQIKMIHRELMILGRALT